MNDRRMREPAENNGAAQRGQPSPRQGCGCAWAAVVAAMCLLVWQSEVEAAGVPGGAAGKPESAELRISAEYAQTFLCPDGRQAIVLQGKVSGQCGGREFAGGQGVIWLRRVSAVGQEAARYEVTAWLQEGARVEPAGTGVAPKGTTDTLMTAFGTTGRVYLTIERRVEKPGFDRPVYQEAARQMRELAGPETAGGKAGAEGAGSGLAVPGAEKREEAGEKKTGYVEEAGGTKPTAEAAPARPAGVVYMQPLGAARIDSFRRADGTDVAVFTGGFYLYQPRPEEDALLELRAENAVVFYSQAVLERAGAREAGALDALGRVVTGVYLEGDVVLDAGAQRITAARLYYDFGRRSALVLDGTMRAVLPAPSLPLYVRAERVRQINESRFRAEGVKLSMDEFYQPHTWLGARTAELVAADAQGRPAAAGKAERYEYRLKDVTANLGDLPVFYWPGVAGDSTLASAPLRRLRTAYESNDGATVESDWELASLLGVRRLPGVDSMLRLDEYTRRGPGTGVDMDYTRPSCFGALRSYLVSDQGEDRLGRWPARHEVAPEQEVRGRVRWQHRQYLPNDWQATTEVSAVSDPTFLESWEGREFDTEKEQETLVYLKQQRDNWAFDFLSQWELNDFEYAQTQLPGAGFHLAGQKLFDVLTYHHDGYLARLGEQAGQREVAGLSGRQEEWLLPGLLDQSDYAFGLSRHEVSLPLEAGGVHVAPTAIGTAVWDDSRRDNEWALGAGGVRASTEFWHVDDSVRSRFWDLERIRHVVTGEASAFWEDSTQQEAATPEVFNFAVRQRWQTYRGPEGEKRSVDVLRFDASVTLVEHGADDVEIPNKFFFSRPETQFDKPGLINADFANLGLARREQINQCLADQARGEWAWLASDTTAVLGDVNYNMRDGDISQAGAGVAVQRTPRLSYYLGDYYLHDGDPFGDGRPPRSRDAHFLTGGATYQLNRKYTLAVAEQFDVERRKDAFTQIVVIRKFPHWYGAFVFGLDSARKSVSFSVSFWPEGLPHIGLGSRRFARLME